MHIIKGNVNWGIIGCGDVCEVKSGPAFSKIPGSTLVAVMRRDAEKAKDFARRHHVPKSYDDATAIIQDPEVNAIYIATPPESHEAYAIEAMKAGKPVYIEKPIALNSHECERMLATSQKLNMPATVAHYRRGLAIFRRVKAILAEGGIGKVNMVVLNLFQAPKTGDQKNPSLNWRINPTISGGGLFNDLSPHQLDIIYWLFGKPVFLGGHAINQQKIYNAPDVTTLTAVFKDDVLFQGVWSFNAPSQALQDSCKIIGEKGTLEFPFFISFTNTKLTIQRDGKTEYEEFEFPVNIQQPMIEQVVAYFKGTGDNPCSLEEALVVMDMMEKAQGQGL